MDSAELRKLFCGGLNEATTDDSLLMYFSQYGDIKTASVVKNPETHQSRKFGFVEFMDRHSADAAVENGPHNVDGKRIDCKLAVKKEIVDGIKNGATKLFVGGIPKDTSQEDIVNFFNSHELNVKVKDFLLKKNRDTGVSRGFGFLTPESDHHLAKIAHVQHFYIRGEQQLECVLANENNRQGGAQGGGRGGYQQGGRGGYHSGGRGGGYQQGGRGGYQQGGRGGYQASSGYGGYGYEQYDQSGYDQSGYGYGGGYGDSYSNGYQQQGYDQSYGYGQVASTGRGRGQGGYGGGQRGGQQARGGAGAGGTYHPYHR